MASVEDQGGTMLQGTIKGGDVIRKFNGQIVLDPRDLARQAVPTPAGSDVTLQICRGGIIQHVHVTMQAMPEAMPIVLGEDGSRVLGLELVSGQRDGGDKVAKVASVDPAGSAADSGIKQGDIILEV
jgi:serine protease Do